MRLREFSRKENSTLFTTVLSAMSVLFSKYSMENDLCIGTHISNRPVTHLEKLFGMFVNTVPVRLRIDETMKFSKTIGYTKDAVLDAIAHQDLPFEKIILELVLFIVVLNIFFKLFVWILDDMIKSGGY